MLEMKTFLVAVICVYNALNFSTRVKGISEKILEDWGKPNSKFIIEK
jgi:hypothetical protein